MQQPASLREWHIHALPLLCLQEQQHFPSQAVQIVSVGALRM
jgi:hypothetical protein